jgi:hypothetical protein
MKNKIVFIFIFILFNLLGSISLFSQSKLKLISGEVYSFNNGEKNILFGLNLIINDTATLFFNDYSDYMVVESSSKHLLIKAENYFPNGFKLSNVNEKKSESSPEGLFSKIFDALFKDEFNEKQKIDDLYITQFQGVTRSIFDSSKKDYNIHPTYYSKLKWSGDKIEIFSEDGLVFSEINSKSNDYNFDEKNIYSLLKCNPCSVLVDNNKSGLIYNKILNDDLEILLKDLNKNILSSTELELSQLLLVRIFIQNEMFLNANYYIDKFKDNLLLSEYLRSGKL